MSQYLLRRGPLHYEVAKFDDSDSPIDVYTIYPRRCSCPAMSKSCKHVKMLNAWVKAGEPIGAVFDDEINIINTLALSDAI